MIRDNPETQVVGYVARRLSVLEQRVKNFGDKGMPCFNDLVRALDEAEPDALLLVTPPEGQRTDDGGL